MSPDLSPLPDLERGLWHSGTRFDRAWMERVLHPDFHESGRSGRVWTREACLAIEACDLRAELRDLAVDDVAPGVALVTYMSVVEYDGLEISNRSSLWLWADDRWQLRFHQGTPTSP